MIPILSGIIVGRGHKITHMHAFILSLAYVLGMAITYAAAGVAAGFSGNLISNALQTPWVLGSFAAVFVLLSLSMFGFYELQLPTALQSKLSDTSNRLHGGHLSGVFVMGALSAIIMGPCVAAPLAGALLYIGQTHDAVLGGVALFVMALGMGAPLLLIGTSAGVLLPKAGAWMEAVKRFFGVMLLALAIWIIQPLLPIGVQMLLWAALLIFSAIYLRALDALPHNASGWHKLLKGIGLLALLLGIAYLIGALSGARDILRPLGTVGRAEAQAPATLQFSRVKDLAELDQRIAQARGQDRDAGFLCRLVRLLQGNGTLHLFRCRRTSQTQTGIAAASRCHGQQRSRQGPAQTLRPVRPTRHPVLRCARQRAERFSRDGLSGCRAVSENAARCWTLTMFLLIFVKILDKSP